MSFHPLSPIQLGAGEEREVTSSLRSKHAQQSLPTFNHYPLGTGEERAAAGRSQQTQQSLSPLTPRQLAARSAGSSTAFANQMRSSLPQVPGQCWKGMLSASPEPATGTPADTVLRRAGAAALGEWQVVLKREISQVINEQFGFGFVLGATKNSRVLNLFKAGE